MSKFPCGICDIGVKYQGIQCTSYCKQWFHSKCLTWSFKKFKNLTGEDIKIWTCDTCKTNDNTTDIENLKLKIQGLSSEEVFDPDKSLTLAAELGNALLSENNNLKQQIHEIKQGKSQNELELEDKLNLANEVLRDLKDKNESLHFVISSQQNKLEMERELKDDFIKQAEAERNIYLEQINELSLLNSNFKGNIENLEVIKTKLNKESEDLKLKLLAQKEKLDSLKYVVESAEYKNKHLELKLREYENTIKTYIKTVSDSFKPYITPDFALQIERSNSWETGDLTMPINPLTAGNSQTCFKKLENSLTDVLLSVKETPTTGSRQTCYKKLKLPLTKTMINPQKSMTSGNRQTCNKKLQNLWTVTAKKPFAVKKQRQTQHSVSLQVAKAQRKITASEITCAVKKDKKHCGKPRMKLSYGPPLTAKQKAKHESYSEFFDKNIDFYRPLINSRKDDSPSRQHNHMWTDADLSLPDSVSPSRTPPASRVDSSAAYMSANQFIIQAEVHQPHNFLCHSNMINSRLKSTSSSKLPLKK